MSVVEFKNERGQIRYQPERPDGRRLYPMGWMKPENAKVFTNNGPKLYRTKRRASRRVSELIAYEYVKEVGRFKEIK